MALICINLIFNIKASANENNGWNKEKKEKMTITCTTAFSDRAFSLLNKYKNIIKEDEAKEVNALIRNYIGESFLFCNCITELATKKWTPKDVFNQPKDQQLLSWINETTESGSCNIPDAMEINRSLTQK